MNNCRCELAKQRTPKQSHLFKQMQGTMCFWHPWDLSFFFLFFFQAYCYSVPQTIIHSLCSNINRNVSVKKPMQRRKKPPHTNILKALTEPGWYFISWVSDCPVHCRVVDPFRCITETWQVFYSRHSYSTTDLARVLLMSIFCVETVFFPHQQTRLEACLPFRCLTLSLPYTINYKIFLSISLPT